MGNSAHRTRWVSKDLSNSSRVGTPATPAHSLTQQATEITDMTYQDFLQDAIDLVDAWDLPEEEFAHAVNQQARLMAGLGLEPSTDIPADSPYSTLRF